MLIDTHAHLDYPDFQNDLPAVIEAARLAGVTRIISIGTGVESSRRAVALAEKYDSVYAVVGLHPTNVSEETGDWLSALRDLAVHPKVAAIGETGMDYYRLPSEQLSSSPALSALQAEMASDTEAAIIDGAYKAAQSEAFEAQLELAADLGLNVVIHQSFTALEIPPPKRKNCSISGTSFPSPASSLLKTRSPSAKLWLPFQRMPSWSRRIVPT